MIDAATGTVNDRKPTADVDARFFFGSAVAYADKNEYVSKGLLFDVQAITYELGAGFAGENRWAVRVKANDGRDEELITLSSNEKRDAQLRRAASFIGLNGPIRRTRLIRVSKAFFFSTSAE